MKFYRVEPCYLKMEFLDFFKVLKVVYDIKLIDIASQPNLHFCRTKIDICTRHDVS